MALDTVALQAWLLAHATTVVGASATLGYEPKSRIDYATMGSTVFAGWFNGIEATQTRGGLATTSARLEWVARLHRNALGPGVDQAETERLLLAATDGLLAEIFADIEVGPAPAGWFDPKGQTGEPVKAVTGFLEIDKQLNRVSTITVGIVVDDAWGEVL